MSKHAKWKKQDTKYQILYDFAYETYLEKANLKGYIDLLTQSEGNIERNGKLSKMFGVSLQGGKIPQKCITIIQNCVNIWKLMDYIFQINDLNSVN